MTEREQPEWEPKQHPLDTDRVLVQRDGHIGFLVYPRDAYELADHLNTLTHSLTEAEAALEAAQAVLDAADAALGMWTPLAQPLANLREALSHLRTARASTNQQEGN